MSMQGGAVRAPVAAGTFYPGSADVLVGEVDELLASGPVQPLAGNERVRGVVTPHAGYVYSGPIAASAYRFLRLAPTPDRMIVLGPSHYEPLRGLAVTDADAWQTPLGDASIDEVGRKILLDAGAISTDAPHRSEHSIEVQMPFLQRCFPGLPVLAVAVGSGDPEAGAEIIAPALAQDALLVVSTDLSHYRDVVTTRRLDGRTASSIEALDVEAIGPHDACGYEALRVGMAWARRHGAGIRLLDLRSSADTTGESVRVVGYGAFGIVEPGR